MKVKLRAVDLTKTSMNDVPQPREYVKGEWNVEFEMEIDHYILTNLQREIVDQMVASKCWSITIGNKIRWDLTYGDIHRIVKQCPTYYQICYDIHIVMGFKSCRHTAIGLFVYYGKDILKAQAYNIIG